MLVHSTDEGGYLHGNYINGMEELLLFYAPPFLSHMFMIPIGVSKSRGSYGVENDKFILIFFYFR
jgi:hypothetical protein